MTYIGGVASNGSYIVIFKHLAQSIWCACTIIHLKMKGEMLPDLVNDENCKSLKISKYIK